MCAVIEKLCLQERFLRVETNNLKLKELENLKEMGVNLNDYLTATIFKPDK